MIDFLISFECSIIFDQLNYDNFLIIPIQSSKGINKV